MTDTSNVATTTSKGKPAFEPLERLAPNLQTLRLVDGLVDPNQRDSSGCARVLFVYRSSTTSTFYSDIAYTPRDETILDRLGRMYFLRGFVVPIPAEYSSNPMQYYYEAMQDLGGVWAEHGWFRDCAERWMEAMPQPSKTVHGLVAYFQSPEKRARNIRTPIKPGKFLQKFFGDVLSQDEIHEAALEWSNHYALQNPTITQDADEIEAVYRGNYNGSCMHFGNGNFAGAEHPARVYAGPDLAIAYLGPQDKAAARCLVWPSKKIYYPKWYGDGSRLEAGLKALGYKDGYENDFDGARIQKIYEDGVYTLPYIDVCAFVDDEGDYLRLGGNEIGCRETRGIGESYTTTCADCGGRVRDDDYCSLDHGPVCADCISSDYFYCYGNDLHYPNDDLANTPDTGRTFSVYYVSRHPDWFQCAGDEKYYRFYYTDYITTDVGTYSLDYAKENGAYECAYSGDWSMEADSKSVLSDGRTIDRSNFGYAGELDAWLEREGVTLIGAMPHPEQGEMRLSA